MVSLLPSSSMSLPHAFPLSSSFVFAQQKCSLHRHPATATAMWSCMEISCFLIDMFVLAKPFLTHSSIYLLAVNMFGLTCLVFAIGFCQNLGLFDPDKDKFLILKGIDQLCFWTMMMVSFWFLLVEQSQSVPHISCATNNQDVSSLSLTV